MKKKKTPHPNTTEKPPCKILYDDIDHLTLRTKPVSIRRIENLAHGLVKWATENDDALFLREFYLQNGMCNEMVKRYIKASPKFAAAIKTAKNAIFVRKATGGLTRKYAENSVLRSLPLYSEHIDADEDFARLEEWRAKLSKPNEEEEKRQTAFVLLTAAELRKVMEDPQEKQ